MKLEQFCDQLLAAAEKAGIETAEIYAVTGSKFNASSTDGSLDRYSVSSSSGLSLRGTVNGKMGYASTQAFDEDAIRQLTEGVIESAALNEAEDQDEIYEGDASYPEFAAPESDIDQITAQQKLDACIRMDQEARKADTRITKVQTCSVATSTGTVLLRNSYGLKLQSADNFAYMYCVPLAQDGDSTTTGISILGSHRFAEIDPDEIASKASRNALEQLHAEPVVSGTYRVIIDHEPMSDLLQTFCGMFSAENAQQKLSLLAGRENTQIAAECVTLVDDPLLPGGLSSSPFDAEGCATYTKTVIDKGVLKTLLHDRKTAKKQGVQTTGNATRAGYSGPVHVGPTNLFIKAGEKTQADLLSAMGDGILITDVSGLHAGANPISGDFSLLSKGFVIHDGVKVSPVEQITIAGNFYDLLKQIRDVANDLTFSVSSIVSPSVDAG